MNTRFEIAEQVAGYIHDSEEFKAEFGRYRRYRIEKVYDDLSIFDWWNEHLSVSQLKQMRQFLKVAEQLGYNGYVCFNVGAAGCSHGMWAYRNEAEDEHGPSKGGCLYHSFRSGDNYYDVRFNDGIWLHDDFPYGGKIGYTLSEVKQRLVERGEL